MLLTGAIWVLDCLGAVALCGGYSPRALWHSVVVVVAWSACWSVRARRAATDFAKPRPPREQSFHLRLGRGSAAQASAHRRTLWRGVHRFPEWRSLEAATDAVGVGAEARGVRR